MSVMYNKYMTLFKNYISLKSDDDLITMHREYANRILKDASILGKTTQDTISEYTAIIVELNRRGLS